MPKISKANKILTNYWLNNYCDDHCTLCGNRGIVDTRDAKTAAGILVGRLNYCICPNGQILRERSLPLERKPTAEEMSALAKMKP
jgi:hypothetical protein